MSFLELKHGSYSIHGIRGCDPVRQVIGGFNEQEFAVCVKHSVFKSLRHTNLQHAENSLPDSYLPFTANFLQYPDRAPLIIDTITHAHRPFEHITVRIWILADLELKGVAVPLHPRDQRFRKALHDNCKSGDRSLVCQNLWRVELVKQSVLGDSRRTIEDVCGRHIGLFAFYALIQ